MSNDNTAEEEVQLEYLRIESELEQRIRELENELEATRVENARLIERIHHLSE